MTENVTDQLKAMQEQIEMLKSLIPEEDLKRAKFPKEKIGTDILVSFYKDQETLQKRLITGWKMLTDDPYVDPATKRIIDRQTIRVFLQIPKRQEDDINRLQKTVESNMKEIEKLAKRKEGTYSDAQLLELQRMSDEASDVLAEVTAELKGKTGEEKKRLNQEQDEALKISNEKQTLLKKKTDEMKKDMDAIDKIISVKKTESEKFVEDIKKMSSDRYVDMDYLTFAKHALVKEQKTITSKSERDSKVFYTFKHDGIELELEATYIN